MRIVEVPSSHIVIIEGIYALSEKLRPLLDLRVSVTGDVHFDLVKRVLWDIQRAGQEPEDKMIEMVSQGSATLEVSLKHSGSLFMYAGNEGGAYAKNSFGNIYTAVGVFVLGRMLREAWGSEAAKKQAEFNDFLERNHMCISMELVTAVLGDHGQCPNEDFGTECFSSLLFLSCDLKDFIRSLCYYP